MVVGGLCHNLGKSGRHNLIQLGIAGDGVGKGQDHILKNEKPGPRFGIVDVLLVVRRQIQPFRQNFAVAAGLIEQADEVAVFQDIFDLRGGKQVFHVLRGPGRDAALLSEPLPNLGAVSRCLFLFQKQMELVGKIPGGLALYAIGGDAAPYLILDNEHPQLFQLLAQILYVEADKPVVDVHIGTVIRGCSHKGKYDKVKVWN